MDTPEQPHQHPAHTGHSWLDIGLAICAMFVSVITLFVAIEHGRTMQRMADANARMVEANSWPFVAFETHNEGERAAELGEGDVRLVLRNQGIGPARIQTFELWYNGQPMSSPKQLFGTCCAITPEEREVWQTTVMGVGATAPTILRAGDHTDFLSMPAPEDRRKMELWRKFNVERDKISVRVCYCSVFDECWIGSGTTTQADRVQSCPAPKVPYQP